MTVVVVGAVLAAVVMAFVLAPLLRRSTVAASLSSRDPIPPHAPDDVVRARLEAQGEALVRVWREREARQCPACGPRPEPDASFCSTCGQRLDACPACGAAVSRRVARFCEACGAPLPGAVAAPRDPAPTGDVAGDDGR